MDELLVDLITFFEKTNLGTKKMTHKLFKTLVGYLKTR